MCEAGDRGNNSGGGADRGDGCAVDALVFVALGLDKHALLSVFTRPVVGRALARTGSEPEAGDSK